MVLGSNQSMKMRRGGAARAQGAEHEFSGARTPPHPTPPPHPHQKQSSTHQPNPTQPSYVKPHPRTHPNPTQPSYFCPLPPLPPSPLLQIFLDMAVLVEAQGEMLDNIEAQVGGENSFLWGVQGRGRLGGNESFLAGQHRRRGGALGVQSE